MVNIIVKNEVTPHNAKIHGSSARVTIDDNGNAS